MVGPVGGDKLHPGEWSRCVRRREPLDESRAFPNKRRDQMRGRLDRGLIARETADRAAESANPPIRPRLGRGPFDRVEGVAGRSAGDRPGELSLRLAAAAYVNADHDVATSGVVPPRGAGPPFQLVRSALDQDGTGFGPVWP